MSAIRKVEEAMNAMKKTLSPYDELVRARTAGKRARKQGKKLSDNPHPQGTGSRGQTECGAWARGWMSQERREEQR